MSDEDVPARRRVKLTARSGATVAEVLVPPFLDVTMPAVIVWGERFFVPAGPSKDTYLEVFGLVVPQEEQQRSLREAMLDKPKQP